MVEAVKGITDYAFSELKANRVEIRCDSLNKKSRAIPEKLGFKLEGILESASVAVDGNGLRDMCVFAMTRNTYEKKSCKKAFFLYYGTGCPLELSKIVNHC